MDKKELPEGWFEHPPVPQEERREGDSHPVESYTFLSPNYKFSLFRFEGGDLELLTIHCCHGLIDPYRGNYGRIPIPDRYIRSIENYGRIPIPDRYIRSIERASEQIEKFLAYCKSKQYVSVNSMSDFLASELDIDISGD